MRHASVQRRHRLLLTLLTASSVPMLLLAAPLQSASGDEPLHVHGTAALNRLGRALGIGYSDGYHTASRRPVQIAGDLPPHPTWYAHNQQIAHGHYANSGYTVSEGYVAPEWIQQHSSPAPYVDERYVPVDAQHSTDRQHSILTPAETHHPDIAPQPSLPMPSNPRLAPPSKLTPAKPVPQEPGLAPPSLDAIDEKPDMELLPAPQDDAAGNEEVANPYGVEEDPNLLIPSPSDIEGGSESTLESADPLDGELLPTPSLELPEATGDGADLLNARAVPRRSLQTRGVIYQPSQNHPRTPLIPIQGRAPRIAVPSPWQRLK
jgi:hypothetical protein